LEESMRGVAMLRPITNTDSGCGKSVDNIQRHELRAIFTDLDWEKFERRGDKKTDPTTFSASIETQDLKSAVERETGISIFRV